MELLRIINIQNHYDRKRRRFNSLAFKNLDGGISVIEKDCIEKEECQHIRRYYSNITGTPPVYWQFNIEILPTGFSIEHTLSKSGDVCHCEIKGLTDKAAKDVFRHYWDRFCEFIICTDSPVDKKKKLLLEDLEEPTQVS